MALKATLYKFRLNVSDLDRHVYGDFPLSVACHPSETPVRMMLRVLSYALHADEALAFGRGISTDDEPDLWLKDLTGEVLLWIDLGTPDPERLRKACGRAREVVLYAYGERAFKVWWEKHADALSRFDNLSVYLIDDATYEQLERFAITGLELQCTVSAGEVYLTAGEDSLELKPQRFQPG